MRESCCRSWAVRDLVKLENFFRLKGRSVRGRTAGTKRIIALKRCRNRGEKRGISHIIGSVKTFKNGNFKGKQVAGKGLCKRWGSYCES